MRMSFETSVLTLGVILLVAPVRVNAGQQAPPGNALNPRTEAPVVRTDPDGIGIVEASRSPTGLLTIVPTLRRPPSTTTGGARYLATFELGAVGFGGDEGAAKFREYKDLGDGAYANNFAVMFEQPKNGFHLDAIGGGVARSDQFYGVDFGSYNAWRVRGYFSETPHVFTSTYRSLWSGGGTDRLTLSGLTPGGTTNANTTQAAMLNVINSAVASDVSLGRKKSRARLDLNLSSDWKTFASYTHERREGSRPFGAVFGGGGGGGNLEVPEVIDYSTDDFVAGLQMAKEQTHLTIQASASMFRNAVDTLTFQNPLFITTNTIAGVPSTTFTEGQLDLYPDNGAFNVRAEVAHKVPGFFRSRFTGIVALGRFSQNDAILPWAIQPLTGGTINGVSTTDAWNSTAALSQTAADRQIDTVLADVGVLMNLTRDLTLRGKVRSYDTDNSGSFLACNPQTGQWGRLLNNGSGGSFVTPNLAAGNNPIGTVATGYNGTGCSLDATRALGLTPSAGDVPLGAAPYEYGQMNATVSADYRLTRASNVEVGYERENFRRPYREREKTGENRLRLGYVNRDFATGSLRLSYERGGRRGGDFVAAPLAEFYSSSLGPTPVAAGTNMASWLRNVEQLRRYDVADRNQDAFSLRFNHGIGSSIDASVGVQVKDQDYPDSAFGRNGTQRVVSPSLEVNWQLSATANAYVFVSRQTGRLQQAGVQQNSCTMGNTYFFFSDGTSQNNATGTAPAPPAGTSLIGTERVLQSNWQTLCATAATTSPLFTTSRTWTTAQRDRNTVAGLGFRHELGPVLIEAAYSRSNGHTGVTYEYDANVLGLNATQASLAGSGYPDLVFKQDIGDASALVPIAGRLSLRLLYRYERADLRDWHYDGIDVNAMPANNAAYLDVGAESYKVHFFGVLFRVGL